MKVLKKIFVTYLTLLKSHNWFRILHVVLLIQIFIGFLYVKPDLSKSVEPPHSIEHISSFKIPLGGFNPVTVGMTWLIMLFLIISSKLVTRNLKEKPSRFQVIFEKIVGFISSLCEDTLGKEKGKTFVPLIGTIFLLVWLSNSAGLIPLPYFEEPTANVNFTLALGLICFITSHVLAIKGKGFTSWIKNYMFALPFYVGMPILVFILLIYILNALLGAKTTNVYASLILSLVSGYYLKQFAPSSLRFYIPNPLEMIGEVGKVVSHSMRLFGNIFGGVIIMVVISKLTKYVMIPTLLSGFFGIFVGTVQAFVFSMLALVYIAVLTAEE